MSTRKIVANTIYFGLIPKLTLLVNVIILPLITPFLTPFDYGVQGVLISYTSLIAMMAPLGMHVHLTNSYFEYPRSYQLIWGRVLGCFLVSGLIFGLINSLILYFVLPFDHSLKLIALCLFGSVEVFLFGNLMLAQHLFPLEAKPKPLVFTNLFASCVGIMVSFILIYYFRLGYWGLIATSAVSYFVNFLLFIKFVWTDYHIIPIIEKNLRRFVKMLKIALPLVPHSMGFVLLSSSAGIVMTFYKIPYNEIGLFNHGCGIGQYIVVITTALVTALSPQAQRSYRSGDYQKYRKLYYLTQSVALISSFLFCIWMTDLYSLLIRNDELKQSSSIASMMCFANVVFPLYTFMGNSAFIEKNTMQLLWLVFVPGFLNLILCFILIPIYGYRVAIYSTMFSYWSQIFIPFFVSYYRRKVTMWLGSLRRLILFLVIIVGSVAIGNHLVHLSLAIRITMSLLCIGVFSSLYFKYKINTII